MLVLFMPRTGVDDGQTVRVNVAAKEISVTFRVGKSDYFRKDNLDIHTDAKISISQAILGGETKIKGLYEDVIIEVRALSFRHYARNLGSNY